MWNSLFHVALYVNDIRTSVAFYQTLGLEVLFGMGNGDGGEDWNYYLRIAKGQYLELQPVHAPNPHPHPEKAQYYPDQAMWHFSLETLDIAAAMQRLRENGIKMWRDPEQSEPVNGLQDVARGADGCLIFWVVDPDGNPIELMEQTERSLQRRHDHD